MLPASMQVVQQCGADATGQLYACMHVPTSDARFLLDPGALWFTMSLRTNTMSAAVMVNSYRGDTPKVGHTTTLCMMTILDR